MKTLNLIAVLLILSINNIFAQDLFLTHNANISFFSKTSIEDIDATSKTCVSAINVKTGELYFKAGITSFEFKSKLMEEHFNENYMESEKFPVAEFKGKITDLVDLRQPGTYTVNVAGQLTLHGVTKNYTLTATIKNMNGALSADAKFKIKLVDHAIEVPTIVFSKIAELIDVTIAVDYGAAKVDLAKK